MTNRLPVLARRRPRDGGWWRPGLPVHPAPEPEATSLAQLALADDPAPCWHTRHADDVAPDELAGEFGAMRWTPDCPIVR